MIKIQIKKATREVTIDKSVIGNDNENLQETLEFNFDEFVDGQARLEVKINGTKSFIMLEKVNETYVMPITNVMTKKGRVNCQLVVTEGTDDESIPLFKSNMFYLVVLESINAQTGAPEPYIAWIDRANEKLNEIDNLDISAEKVDTTTTITITKKDGTEETVEILDGEQGEQGIQGETGPAGQDGADGQDATINGVNTLNIVAGTNIDLSQTGSTLEINNTYDDTEILSAISSLETNKANVSDIPTKTSDLQNNSGFIDKTVNNLTNYTLKTSTGSLIDLEINSSTYVVTLYLKDIDGNVISTDNIDLPLESVVVSGSFDSANKKIVLTLQNGNTVDIPVGDLVAGLQTEITNQNKLASDLVDDSNSGNKFTNASEKQTWNAKYDKPVGGIPSTDLSSGVQTSLGKADTAVQDVSGKEDKSNKVTSLSSS